MKPKPSEMLREVKSVRPYKARQELKRLNTKNSGYC